MERHEIPGQPVTVTVRKSGRYCPVTNTVWDGLHIVTDGGTEYLADRSVVHDAGPLGAGMSYIAHTDAAPDRAALDMVIRQVCPGARLKGA